MDPFYTKALAYLAPHQQKVPKWMEQIKIAGETQKIPIVRDDLGWFLRMICSLARPEKILEIGCGISYSTHWMLLGSGKSQIIALDGNNDRIDMAEKFLKSSGYDEQVTLLNCFANEFFSKNKQTFDFIFQDASKKDYLDMLTPCYQSLNKDGIMVVDNIFFNGKVITLSLEDKKKYSAGVEAVKKFNHKIAELEGLECTFLPFSDGVLVAKKIS